MGALTIAEWVNIVKKTEEQNIIFHLEAKLIEDDWVIHDGEEVHETGYSSWDVATDRIDKIMEDIELSRYLEEARAEWVGGFLIRNRIRFRNKETGLEYLVSAEKGRRDAWLNLAKYLMDLDKDSDDILEMRDC